MKNLFKTALLSIVFSCNLADACINDSDTHFFERQSFPNIEQLMTADFVTHTKEFYQWRITDRLEKLKKDKNNPALYDDLSVSYEKTGQTQKAIDTLIPILERYPERYETLANLGTFYIHHGEYLKGVELLKKAIKINPQAHFGRETYQIKVVEYLLEQNPSGKVTFPVQKNKLTFADYVLKNVQNTEKDGQIVDNVTEEILKAIVGVGGMLKFGNSDSPILLEAMGDLYKKLDQLNLYHKPRGSYTTYFGKVAMLSYYSAANKTNVKLATYFKIKDLSTTMFPEDIGYLLKNSNDRAVNNRQENTDKENAIVKSGIDVEERVYAALYDAPKEQEDLYLTAHKRYEEMLKIIENEYADSRLEAQSNFRNDIKTSITVFSCLLGIYYVFAAIKLAYIFAQRMKKKDNKPKYNVKRLIKVTLFWVFMCLIVNSILLYKFLGDGAYLP